MVLLIYNDVEVENIVNDWNINNICNTTSYFKVFNDENEMYNFIQEKGLKNDLLRFSI